MDIKEFINKEYMLDTIQSMQETYKSEAQFQFRLAQVISESLRTNRIENEPKVILEYLGAAEIAYGKTKRLFTDIMVLDNTGNYIPIELKYKTRSVKGAVDIFSDYATHGATDFGRFDFLWDIQRIGLLKNKSCKGYVFNNELKTYCGGFAVLLTNEEKYWTVTRDSFKDPLKLPLYYEFCIGEGQQLSGKLNWKNKGLGTCVENTARGNAAPLLFDNPVVCHWEPYIKAEDTQFRFLVIPVA